MTVTTESFAAWLEQAHLHEPRLTAQQAALLHAAFAFRQQQGHDYYANRLLAHFLLHCGSGLKVAQLARLLGVSRTTASGQQGLSSRQAIQQAHHRMAGRPHGKLLPRYAGPIAGYLFAHPKASRADLIDFIAATFDVHVSRVALYHFLKKYGLDETPGPDPTETAAADESSSLPVPLPRVGVPELPTGTPLPLPAPPFSPHARSMPAPSFSCPRR